MSTPGGRASIRRQVGKMAVEAFEGVEGSPLKVMCDVGGSHGFVWAAFDGKPGQKARLAMGLMLARLRRDLPSLEWSAWLYPLQDEAKIFAAANDRAVRRGSLRN